ncbi:hypothetical protein ACFSHR_08580 [Azotobacter chroococcum]
MKHHPIQLIGVLIEKLELTVHDRFRFEDDNYAKSAEYTIFNTKFDEENSTIGVKVQLSIKPADAAPEKLDRPYSLIVTVVGNFKVDVERFPVEYIQDWAVKNAPIILLPFIREHAYSLSARAGFNPVLLPLVEVPNFVIDKKNNKIFLFVLLSTP